ncbi:MAG: T9SS type A sorting domain-containing protein [Bacteroidota bacterium]
MNLIQYIFCFLFYLVSNFLFAQKENNIWHFGQNAGLNFNSGSPVAFTNSAMNLLGGSASICDSSGSLLFYTDGITVWNKNNIPMPNGDSLTGYIVSSQPALIVKQPGNNSIYYIFTADDPYSFPVNYGFRYSIVNMGLEGGLGDVTQKNTLLFLPTTRQQTAIKHCNNRDVWIIAHESDTTIFRSYLLSDTGLSAPINSYTGLGNASSNSQGTYLKPSPLGNKIAQTIGNLSTLPTQIFNFNRSTGELTLFAAFATLSGGGGSDVEFSPDGKKLYLATEMTPPLLNKFVIYQYNLLAGSSIDIANSQLQVGVVEKQCFALQMAPDGKIYTARKNKDSLGVINNPNQLGIACNYVDNGVSLASKVCQLGLPNFFYMHPIVPTVISSFNYTDTLYGDTTLFNISNVSDIDSVVWNFDDIPTGLENTSSSFTPSHIFSSSKIYNVQLIVYYSCSIDTINKSILIDLENGLASIKKDDRILKIYPNPTTNQIAIEFELKEIKNTSIEIKNILALTIKTIDCTAFSKGKNKIEIDISEFSKGVYFIHLQGENKILSKKFVKQ